MHAKALRTIISNDSIGVSTAVADNMLYSFLDWIDNLQRTFQSTVFVFQWFR